MTLRTTDRSEDSPTDCSRHSPTTSPHSTGHDETLAHLVRMVESNDLTDHDDHVPFVDLESKGSMSEYSGVEDNNVPEFFQSASSSGYSGEIEEILLLVTERFFNLQHCRVEESRRLNVTNRHYSLLLVNKILII